MRRLSVLCCCLALAWSAAHADPNADLLTAAAAGNLQGIQTALQQGADANTADKDGNTPLILAAQKGSMAIAQLLLFNGAESSARNNSGLNANRVAKQENNRALSRLLTDEDHAVFASNAVTIDFTRLNLTPDGFKRAAIRAFEARRWIVESTGAGTVSGSFDRDKERVYKADIRMVGSRVYISFLKGYGRETNSWLFNLASDMMFAVKNPTAPIRDTGT
jgi:Ankyrin repeats (many copies)